MQQIQVLIAISNKRKYIECYAKPAHPIINFKMRRLEENHLFVCDPISVHFSLHTKLRLHILFHKLHIFSTSEGSEVNLMTIAYKINSANEVFQFSGSYSSFNFYLPCPHVQLNVKTFQQQNLFVSHLNFTASVISKHINVTREMNSDRFFFKSYILFQWNTFVYKFTVKERKHLQLHMRTTHPIAARYLVYDGPDTQFTEPKVLGSFYVASTFQSLLRVYNENRDIRSEILFWGEQITVTNTWIKPNKSVQLDFINSLKSNKSHTHVFFTFTSLPSTFLNISLNNFTFYGDQQDECNLGGFAFLEKKVHSPLPLTETVSLCNKGFADGPIKVFHTQNYYFEHHCGLVIFSYLYHSKVGASVTVSSTECEVMTNKRGVFLPLAEHYSSANVQIKMGYSTCKILQITTNRLNSNLIVRTIVYVSHAKEVQLNRWIYTASGFYFKPLGKYDKNMVQKGDKLSFCEWSANGSKLCVNQQVDPYSTFTRVSVKKDVPVSYNITAFSKTGKRNYLEMYFYVYRLSFFVVELTFRKIHVVASKSLNVLQPQQWTSINYDNIYVSDHTYTTLKMISNHTNVSLNVFAHVLQRIMDSKRRHPNSTFTGNPVATAYVKFKYHFTEDQGAVSFAFSGLLLKLGFKILSDASVKPGVLFECKSSVVGFLGRVAIPEHKCNVRTVD